MRRSRCWRQTVHAGSCRVCGGRPEMLHVPLRCGCSYCPRHCPACTGGPGEREAPSAGVGVRKPTRERATGAKTRNRGNVLARVHVQMPNRKDCS